MSYEIKAIETRYAGHLFRSRLEARWAAMFDLLGWKWTYEPFDLNGWVPDFLLSPLTSEGSEVLVEVKGPRSEWEAAKAKILAAIPRGDCECLMVGISPLHNMELIGWYDSGTTESASELFDLEVKLLHANLRSMGLSEEEIQTHMITSDWNESGRQQFVEQWSGIDGIWEEAVISDLRPTIDCFDFCSAYQSYRQILSNFHEDSTCEANPQVLTRLWGQAHQKTRFTAR